MLYAAMTFWLLIVVLAAWGVHQLWSGLIKPRMVNVVLLPGTLVAQLGHVLGLLVTGGSVQNTTLYKDDETGAPEQTQDPKPRVPFVGPVIVGMLPILACATAIYYAAHHLGGVVVQDMNREMVASVLPTTLPTFWELLRNSITLAETTLAAAVRSNLSDWHVWLFLYLLVCLTVRMAPFPGNLRGSLGAIILLGFLAFVVGMIATSTPESIRNGWPVLSLAVGTVLVLLLFSLLVRGGVGLYKLLAGNA